jgi:hypothetical protein
LCLRATNNQLDILFEKEYNLLYLIKINENKTHSTI